MDTFHKCILATCANMMRVNEISEVELKNLFIYWKTYEFLEWFGKWESFTFKQKESECSELQNIWKDVKMGDIDKTITLKIYLQDIYEKEKDVAKKEVFGKWKYIIQRMNEKMKDTQNCQTNAWWL